MTTWLWMALLGYFFLAFSQLLDKLLLSKHRISQPAVYTFYVALFSLFALIFSPFGFVQLPAVLTSIFLASGVLFTYSLLAFYYAVRDYDIARVAPLYGLISTITIVVASFLLPEMFGEVGMSSALFWALGFFVAGGFLIAYDLPLQKRDHLSVSVVIAGVLYGMSLLLLKYGYGQADFVNGLVWSRLGAFCAGMALLLIPVYRKQILVHHEPAQVKSTRNLQTMALFVVNKTAAGIASFLILFATAAGSVAVVQALAGMQYVFLLALVIPASFWLPSIFHEHNSKGDWIQKILALALIGIGFYWLAQAGIIIEA